MQTETEYKAFGLGALLSVTTGRLLCEIGDLYEILNHLTGDNLFTHVLPRAMRFAAPRLAIVFPELEKAVTEDMLDGLCMVLKESQTPMDDIKKWLLALPLPQEVNVPSYVNSWLSLDPIAELESVFSNK